MTSRVDLAFYKELYERQVALLQLFLEKHAIDRTQYEKSLHDLTAKFKKV